MRLACCARAARLLRATALSLALVIDHKLNFDSKIGGIP